MPIRDIPGQETAKRMLINSLRRSKLSHAYIFDGPVGSGKRAMALALAQAIFCQTPQDGDACGICVECRKTANGNHLDLVWIKPDGATIKISQIEDLQKEFSFKSNRSKTRVYVMLEAERLSDPAANSLLKFLEEPQSTIIALLLTVNEQSLLPTIRSRSQRISFYPPSKEETIKQLCEEGYQPHLVIPAVQLTAGLDLARELIQGNGFAEARNVVIQLMKEALTRLPTAMLTLQNRWLKTEWSEHTQILLDLQHLWFKDMILLNYGRSEEVVFTDQVEWMAPQAQAKSFAYWVKGMEITAEVKKRIRMNANPQLAIEQMLIEIQEV